MEPRREEQQKPPEVRGEPKPKRFRLIRLEERIAPQAGGNPGKYGTGGHRYYDTGMCAGSATCSIE
jgi:hypothetical protein